MSRILSPVSPVSPGSPVSPVSPTILILIVCISSNLEFKSNINVIEILFFFIQNFQYQKKFILNSFKKKSNSYQIIWKFILNWFKIAFKSQNFYFQTKMSHYWSLCVLVKKGRSGQDGISCQAEISVYSHVTALASNKWPAEAAHLTKIPAQQPRIRLKDGRMQTVPTYYWKVLQYNWQRKRQP